MNKFTPILLLTLLASCTTETMSSNLVSSQSASSLPRSTASISSLMIASSTSMIATSSSAPTLANIWTIAMGNINPLNFYGLTETLPTTLSSNNVIVVHAVYRQDGSLYGYAYEALVDGNGGTKTNRFRLGLVNNQFTGFQSVSHQEHNGIGTVIIQALATQLAGNTATFSAALQIMLNANSTLTGFTASVTLVGMRPALEAIVTHYLSKI
jgi:hypothetical protein